VADYCGTSVEMIERHYAKWLQGDDEQLRLLARETPSPTRVTDRDAVPISRAKAGKNGTSRDLREVRNIARKR
jgi:hypothetical protein